jgi:hypothetical protein
VGEPRPGDAVLQMKGHATMADYHFRVNAERLGVDLSTLITRIEWPEEKPGECRFMIEAPAAEETLSLALGEAVRLIGLRAERDVQ